MKLSKLIDKTADKTERKLVAVYSHINGKEKRIQTLWGNISFLNHDKQTKRSN